MSSKLTPNGGSSHAPERRSRNNHIASWFGGSRVSDKHIGVGRGVVWLAALVLIFAAWPVSQGSLYKPGSGLGYYMGVTGGIMMLLMLLYPVRKHMQFARNWGPLRYWFMLHMLFGIAGPTLVLFHSTFHVKSLNAGVALFSMLLVAVSGIIGRFIYKRIHHGLYGRKSNLEELRQAVETNPSKASKINAVLMEATGAGEKLQHFRIRAMDQNGTFSIRLWQFLTLGWQRRTLARHVRRTLHQAVTHLANIEGWNRQQQELHFHAVIQDTDEYLRAVQQAAQFTSYERLFRLWHILHSPFVWLLAISGVVHVIAVNMY